jgi:hypothetical protein
VGFQEIRKIIREISEFPPSLPCHDRSPERSAFVDDGDGVKWAGGQGGGLSES